MNNPLGATDPTGYFGTVVDGGEYQPEIKPLDEFDSDVNYEFQTTSNLNIGNHNGRSGSADSDLGGGGSSRGSIDTSNVEFYEYGPPANGSPSQKITLIPDDLQLKHLRGGLYELLFEYGELGIALANEILMGRVSVVHDELGAPGGDFRDKQITVNLNVPALYTEVEVVRTAFIDGVDPREALNAVRTSTPGTILGHEIGHTLGLGDPSNIVLVDRALKAAAGRTEDFRDSYRGTPMDSVVVDPAQSEIIEQLLNN